MSVPAIHHDRAPFWGDAHRLATVSLLMVPALLVWFLVVLMPVGWAIQSALGLEDTQALYEAGAWGVAAFVLVTVLMAVPPTVGIVLGVRARRLREQRLGTMGVVANAVVAVFFVLAPVLEALFG